MLLIVIIVWWAYSCLVYTSQSFKLEWISVSFDKSNNSTRAEWNIGSSVKAGKHFKKLDYNGLNVLFRCMSPNWSRTVLVQSSNDQDPKNMTSLNATVDTLLPHSFQGSTLGFDVMFRVKFVRDSIQAVCNNLTVRFSPDATDRMMEGGPRSCHYHYK